MNIPICFSPQGTNTMESNQRNTA